MEKNIERKILSNFLEGLVLFDAEPVIDFTPEYRLYYNKETGDILKQVAIEYNVEPPEGDFIIVERSVWESIRSDNKIIDGEIKTPSKPQTYNLVKSETGMYGTRKNNPYFIGTEDFYEYRKDFE